MRKHNSQMTDADVPDSGIHAFTEVLTAMDHLDGMYGPQSIPDYIRTCEALREELDARINAATQSDQVR